MNARGIGVILVIACVGWAFVGDRLESAHRRSAMLEEQNIVLRAEVDSLCGVDRMRRDSIAASERRLGELRIRYDLLSRDVRDARARLDAANEAGPNYATTADTSLALAISRALYGPGGRIARRDQ